MKQLPVAQSINSRLKCWQTKRTYAATTEHYARLSRDKMVELCPPVGPRHNEWKTGGRRPRIFLLGTDEQQDKSGFIQALERVGEVEVFTRDDGAYGQNDPAPYDDRRRRNTQRLWTLVSSLADGGWVPDLLISQTWAALIDPACFSRIRTVFGTYIINVAMDDRHQYWGNKVHDRWDGTYPLISHIDLTLTAAPDAVDWYRKEGGSAIFFPEASDATIFHPMPDLPKVNDVSFVGGCYGIRERIVLALRLAGVQVAAYGSGWQNGRIETEDVPRLFAQSKIVLGVSTIGHCADFVGLKLRDFDAPMSGSCYLTQDNPDLHHLYAVGQELVTYRTPDECVAQAKRLLIDHKDRESIARAGRRRVEVDHTWDRRFSELMTTLRYPFRDSSD